MLRFTPAELERAVEDGWVTKRPHPTLPYFIYNYTPEVQYSNYWNEITMNCRGLILDDQYNIIARPWRKFFNLGQVDLPIQFDTPVEVMDKADGSLGILYPTPEGFDIATRGSFESEQAHTASAIWWGNYHEYYNDSAEREVLQDYTILFEIIYPSNRIVLDYGGMTDLVLLGSVGKSTGFYYGPKVTANMIAWPGPVVEVMPFNTLSEALGKTDRPNAEGYVIRSHNFMVKIKQPDYLELHKLVTNATPKTVWEQLRAGKSKEQIVSVFPDEFHDYIGSMIDPLLEQFKMRAEEIMLGFENVIDSFMSHGDDFNRGGFARYIEKAPDKRYYFLMLDGREIRDVLWTELKPRETIDA